MFERVAAHKGKEMRDREKGKENRTAHQSRKEPPNKEEEGTTLRKTRTGKNTQPNKGGR